MALMVRTTRELLAALRSMNLAVPTIVVKIADESLPVADQVEFGALLVELGERVQAHAHQHRRLVVDSPDTSPSVPT
jgi:hypothetical protein